MSKYPVKSQEPIARKFANNYIPKSNHVVVNRPPNPSAIHRPSVPSQLQYSPYVNVNVPSNIPVPEPHRPFPEQPSNTFSYRSINTPFGAQTVDEYLLHGQMPLTVGQTYVMPNTAQTDETEYLT